MARLKVRVAQRSAEGASNVGIRLEALEPGGSLPPFDAGAHVDVFLPGGIVRQYSIANAPHDTGHYLLCVKLQAQSRGGSRFIHEHLAAGAELEISTPRNLFALRPAEHSVLIGAGIGITPLLSMAAHLAQEQQSFSLHYYTRSAEDVALRGHLGRFSSAQVQLHHSNLGRSPRTYVPAELHPPQPGTHLYLCGPLPFMAQFRQRALQGGWPDEHIHTEAFSASDTAPPAEPGSFEVQLNSTGTVYPVPAGETIAQVLQAAGVAVSLSCEQGICGACLTGVVAGEPLHCDAVLSEAEQALNNQMALCCSRSRSPRLVLDL
ncbi:PDR/VanB family oxidoreductase [Pseudomonas typographi]|uniref:Oxidoreductase n=1 Tax=Pseudomonas typographi TaxID=2715964 RepID=A0ABR7Z100_9PSED|nr:PDR/VanB family oxidoreductase [Pseudomonas typographi]MBD1552273.1 oxidoreductase [Pseudomonas typographi]MBD1587393.1 oxidoreductase [Pseudomonas typographi]MBD1599112.1 oxidoreductase [Pseudomonas typographi]